MYPNETVQVPIAEMTAAVDPQVFAGAFVAAGEGQRDTSPLTEYGGIMIPHLPPDSPQNRALFALQAYVRKETGAGRGDEAAYVTRFLALMRAVSTPEGADGDLKPFLVRNERGWVYGYMAELLLAAAEVPLHPIEGGYEYVFDIQELATAASNVQASDD